MNIVKIVGERQTGRTSILIDIAKRSLKNNLKVLLVVLNEEEKKRIMKENNWCNENFNEEKIKVVSKDFKLCGVNVDVLLIDNAEIISKDELYDVFYPSVIKPTAQGIIYETRLQGDEK